MHNLVLAVKDLDEKNKKRNLKQINEFNEKLYNVVQEIISDNASLQLLVEIILFQLHLV